MSFFRRSLLLAVLLPTLVGCGFTPLYGKHGVPAGLQSIHIGNIPDRSGQYLRNALIDRFYNAGESAQPAYLLTIEPVREKKTDLDITKSSDATRAQLRMTTKMILSDRVTGETLLAQELTSVTSYNILSSQFTTRVSEDNARMNALDDLSRQIETRLTLYFSRR